MRPSPRPEDVRVVFFGTPAFGVPALAALATARYRIIRVVTQPPRARGRHGTPVPSDVARAATVHGIPVDTPHSLRDRAWIAGIAAEKPTVGIVAAYGKILPPPLLRIPTHGFVNIHPSLLPRWRGPSPISWTIRAGDQQSGVTFMLLDAGMDTGPIIAQEAFDVPADATTQSLTERMSRVGADMLFRVLPQYLAGLLTPHPQAGHGVTIAPALSRADGRLSWDEPAAALERHVRAMFPWPGSWTTWHGGRLKLTRAHVAAPDETPHTTQTTGSVQQTATGFPAVRTGDGSWLVLDALQREGRRVQSGAEFLRGANGFLGANLSA
ncbi:MAG: methionyl-tRNA formyltransferase [Candidatus Kerfeldbacteria bacterium]|nr:methionyl-tRNA formyltransferase [Candidatus Kerfeldbacteria bacterium]